MTISLIDLFHSMTETMARIQSEWHLQQSEAVNGQSGLVTLRSRSSACFRSQNDFHFQSSLMRQRQV